MYSWLPATGWMLALKAPKARSNGGAGASPPVGYWGSASVTPASYPCSPIAEPTSAWRQPVARGSEAAGHAMSPTAATTAVRGPPGRGGTGTPGGDPPASPAPAPAAAAAAEIVALASTRRPTLPDGSTAAIS